MASGFLKFWVGWQLAVILVWSSRSFHPIQSLHWEWNAFARPLFLLAGRSLRSREPICLRWHKTHTHTFPCVIGTIYRISIYTMHRGKYIHLYLIHIIFIYIYIYLHISNHTISILISILCSDYTINLSDLNESIAHLIRRDYLLPNSQVSSWSGF